MERTLGALSAKQIYHHVCQEVGGIGVIIPVHLHLHLRDYESNQGSSPPTLYTPLGSSSCRKRAGIVPQDLQGFSPVVFFLCSLGADRRVQASKRRRICR